jgi:hypothetical protein
MRDDWLQVADDRVDEREVMRTVRERLARRSQTAGTEGVEDPAAVVDSLRREMLADDEADGEGSFFVRESECDIVPRAYRIDWRVPVLGRLHALVRRIINAEIQRYLLPALQQQSHVNRRVARALQDLSEENARLRALLEERQGPGGEEGT